MPVKRLHLPIGAWLARTPAWISGLLLVAIALVRVIHLDADPGLIKSLLNNAADVGDEAYWSAAARNLTLFGTVAADDYFQGATSPFYSIMTFFSYWLFGVSLYTTRIPNAVLAITAVLVTYRLIAPYSRPAAFLAGLMLALENNFFIHTRMGQVEAACGVWALIAFYLLIRSKAPFWAGMMLGLSVATKIVALLLVPAFVLFFLLQWARSATSRREVVRFGAGFACIGIALLGFVVYFHGGVGTIMDMALVRKPFQVVYDFVTGFNVLNPTHYEGDSILQNVIMQSQGTAIMRNPARVLIDFVTGYYLSYPTTILLVLLLGAYAWRARLDLWVGRGAWERLRRVTDVEVMVIAWLVGHSLGMLLFSDMHDRRMNLFTIPLALVPSLLVLRVRPEIDEAPRGVQTIMLCIPIIYAGMLIGRKALGLLAIFDTGSSLLAAGLLMVLGTWTCCMLFAKRSPAWWRSVRWVAFLAWVVLASLSLGYSLPSRILPNLAVTNHRVMIVIVLGFLVTMLWLGLSALRKPAAVIAVTLLLGCGLDMYDLFGSSFSSRDASLRMRTITAAEDWVVGDGAHVLSLNATYYPVQAYPRRGINKDFLGRVRPRFFSKIVDATNRIKWLSDPAQTEYSVKEADFYAIGATRIEPLADFPLYPVLQQPAEMTYRLYRVTY